MNGSLAIVRRELPSLLRLKRTLCVFVIVALAFSVTVLMKWPSTSTADLSGFTGKCRISRAGVFDVRRCCPRHARIFRPQD